MRNSENVDEDGANFTHSGFPEYDPISGMGHVPDLRNEYEDEDGAILLTSLSRVSRDNFYVGLRREGRFGTTYRTYLLYDS